ncbi:MAG: hypothetical protein MUC95_02145 [Spirochaetes bacterium]|jgi:hypothetical protein|nr:hypothetical protein [Spirochaetota bacterium]
MSNKQIAEDIFEEIKMKNSQRGLKSLPHSDEFLHYISSSQGIDSVKAKEMIQLLISAHKIFAIEVVAFDKELNIPRVEAYVEASLPVITRLKNFYQDELVKMYENEYYRRISFFKAVKEIFPIIKSLNNTSIGQIANKAIMLGELEKLLEKNFSDYTDSWKEKNFELELYRISGEIEAKGIRDGDNDAGVKKPVVRKSGNYERAVDSKKYGEFISKSKGYPIDRILKIYGLEFFLRVHIRNYKFLYLIEIVEKGNVFHKNDLILLRDLLHTVKMNFERDTRLEKYRDEIQTLERSISHNLYFRGLQE